MMMTKNISINTLHANSLETKSLKVESLNGVTIEEMANLSGVKGNVQHQLDNLSDITIKLKSMWRTQATDDVSL